MRAGKSSIAVVAALTAALALLVPVTPSAREPEAPAARDARMAWWREARFGMFIHWGPVSLRGTEIGWSRQTINRKLQEIRDRLGRWLHVN